LFALFISSTDLCSQSEHSLWWL